MIEFKDVTKSYKNVKVIKNLNLKIEDNELVVLIGSSGCGKTTTLKMINRLIKPTSGSILINNKSIKSMDKVKLRRNIGYVIQQTGLFPHMTIRDNIEIIAKLEGYEPDFISKRTLELMEMVDLDADTYLDRYPNELSGGQQQRVGVARAFALNPDIILMDEPFSALDPITRSQLQEELILLQKKLHKTIVFVTHDMDEAVKIADKICILDDGEVIQYDTTENILKNPINDFVKDFVGADRIWTMLELIKAEDIMSTSPIFVNQDTPISMCMQKVLNHKVTSLFVVDDKKTLLGILTLSIFTKIKDRKVLAKDIMKTEILTIHKDESILSLIQEYNENNSIIIPVLDDDKRLIGVITNGTLVSVLSQPYTTEDSSFDEFTQNEIPENIETDVKEVK